MPEMVRAQSLLYDTIVDLQNPYYAKQLITYIGNKRALLGFINRAVETVKKKLGKQKVVLLDGFAGSGVVARLLKAHASFLHANDLETYSRIVNLCYLGNEPGNWHQLAEQIAQLNHWPEDKYIEGFIARNYAPRDDNNIQPGERVFYTHKNAQIIDTLKAHIFSSISREQRHFFLAPLLVEASIHTNTSGVFKGFHKKNGIGHFGGAGENALTRILGRITLPVPLFSPHACDVLVTQHDINELVTQPPVPEYDIAYFDPPYNQHPYGSNYFMLNIIASEEAEVAIQDGVSGIAKDWNHSAYNHRQRAIDAMDALIRDTPAKYILLSYNNEGIIPEATLRGILEKHGEVSRFEQEYNTYRGSRNLRARNIKVRELLWAVKRK